MIYRIRTLTLSTDAIQQARALAVQGAAYSNETYPEVHCEILSDSPAVPGQFYWSTRCESQAVLDQYEEKRNADPKWQKRLADWSALPGEKAMSDAFYEVVTA